jgi:hypothetical protein
MEHLSPNNYDMERVIDDFGKVLHAVQDFYSHSNWVDHQSAGNIDAEALIDESFGFFPVLEPYSVHSGAMVVQGADETPFGPSSLWREGNLVFVARDGIRYPGIITGTVMIGEDDTPNNVALSHGGLAGAKFVPGSLAKDSCTTLGFSTCNEHELDLHNTARRMATDQTRHEFARLCNLTHDFWGNEGSLRLVNTLVKPDAGSQRLAGQLCWDNSVRSGTVEIGVTDRPSEYTWTLIDGTAFYAPTVDNASIGASVIQADLDAGRNVTVLSGELGGDIIVAENIVKTEGGATTLELKAADSIFIRPNSDIASEQGPMHVVLHSDSDSSNGGRINISGVSINSNGGDIVLGGGINPMSMPAVGIAGLGNESGVLVEDSTVNAAGGNIVITARGVSEADSGLTRPQSPGILVIRSGISSESGDITFSGTGGDSSGVANYGVELNAATTIQSTSGNITITGTGGGRGQSEVGVFLDDNAGQGPSAILTESGHITVNGSGSPTGEDWNFGVQLGRRMDHDANRIQATGSGSITINATAGAGTEEPRIFGRTQALVSNFGGIIQSGTGDITINADSAELPGTVQAQGSLTIRPTTPGTSVAIGDNALGTLKLFVSDWLRDGNFDSITIGDRDNTGVVNIDRTVPFQSDLNVLGEAIAVTSLSAPENSITLGATNVDIVADAEVTASALTIGYQQLGIGTSVTVDGTIKSTAGAFILGSDEADRFEIKPQADSYIEVWGSDPTTTPGDTLIYHGAGVDHGTHISGAGVRAVEYWEIETVRIQPPTTSDVGDLDDDGDMDIDDINLLVRGIRDDVTDPAYDIDGTGILNVLDILEWLSIAGNANNGSPYLPGDTDLDGDVDSADLNVVGINWQHNVDGWSQADFNADGVVDSTDLNALGVNWQSGNALAAPTGRLPRAPLAAQINAVAKTPADAVRPVEIAAPIGWQPQRTDAVAFLTANSFGRAEIALTPRTHTRHESHRLVNDQQDGGAQKDVFIELADDVFAAW